MAEGELPSLPDGVVVRDADGAVEFAVRVRPASRTAEVIGSYGDRLKIAVREAPEQGRANAAVCRLLAEYFGVGLARVSVVRGLTSRDKVVRVERHPG